MGEPGGELRKHRALVAMGRAGVTCKMEWGGVGGSQAELSHPTPVPSDFLKELLSIGLHPPELKGLGHTWP